MDLTREYVATAVPVVLLVCDYYEVAKAAKSKKILDAALFPVGSIALIDLILSNLADQNFTNVILAGRRVDPVAKHVNAGWQNSGMNVATFKPTGDSLGDLFREMDAAGFEMGDMLVMYANTYTNTDLSALWRKHKESDGKNILTIHTYEKNTFDDAVHVYGTEGCRVLFYQKLEDGKLDADDLFHVLPKHKGISVDYTSSSPTIVAASPVVFSLFNENFDYQTFGDLLVGELANEHHGKIFEVVRDSDPSNTGEQDARCCRGTESDRFMNGVSFGHEKKSYSREILTMRDLSRFTSDIQGVLRQDQAMFDVYPSKMQNDHKMHVSGPFIGACCTTEHGVAECYLWDAAALDDSARDGLGFSSMGHMLYDLGNVELDGDGGHFEIVIEEESSEACGLECQSFFNNMHCLLHAYIKSPTFYDNNLDDLHKQISLLRIVWNASRPEAIEAFGYFFVKMLDLKNLEDSLSKASVFFGILSTCIVNRQDEELLMETIYNNIYNMDYELKVQILFNYGFLFVQNGIIDKSVVKRYNKMYKANVL